MRALANLHGHGAPAPANSIQRDRTPDSSACHTTGHGKCLPTLFDSAAETARAFAEWLSSQPSGRRTDRNAELIVDTLWPLVQQGRLAIPRGGYPVGRGRGWVIVEPEAVAHGVRYREGMGSNGDEAR